MSYILDALKKAEAERNGDTPPVPPMLPLVTRNTKPRGASPLRWMWPALAAGVTALVVLLWQTDTPRPAPAPAPATAKPASEAPRQTQAAAPVPARAKTAMPAPAQTSTRSAPALVAAPSVPPEKPPAPVPPATGTAEPPVLTLRELPEHVRNELPQLTINGYIYAGDKADRYVLINNRLRREGDEIAPGVYLEKMQPGGMVLSYKDYRYRMPY